LKPILMIGAGNPLAGDDGVGAALAEDIARDPAWRDRADAIVGACDLLRLGDQMRGREAVVVIDALLDEGLPPGTVTLHAGPFDAFDDRAAGAHELSAVGSIELLRAASPELRDTCFLLVTVAVPGLDAEATLSARLPAISARVRDLLGPALGPGTPQRFRGPA
jgi:hydrogenase maturation protease